MLAWLRSWKGGLAVSAICLVGGLGRIFVSAGNGDRPWLTPTLLVLAVAYGGAAFVHRRMLDPRRPVRLAAPRERGDDPGIGHVTGGGVAVLTKDRVGAVLAITAAVIGLVLVFDGRESGASADDNSVTPPASQLLPGPNNSHPGSPSGRAG